MDHPTHNKIISFIWCIVVGKSEGNKIYDAIIVANLEGEQA